MKEKKVKFDTAEQLVRRAVTQHRCLLKDDAKLCVYIYSKLGYGGSKFLEAFLNAHRLGLPSYKTIMRTRLEVQKEFKEEAVEMKRARVNLTEEYIDYGLRKTLGRWQ